MLVFWKKTSIFLSVFEQHRLSKLSFISPFCATKATKKSPASANAGDFFHDPSLIISGFP